MVGPPEVQDAMKKLEENFNEYVRKYGEEKKAQLEAGKIDVLNQELEGLKEFLELIYKGEVDTTTSEQDFVSAKIRILEDLLDRS